MCHISLRNLACAACSQLLSVGTSHPARAQTALGGWRLPWAEPFYTQSFLPDRSLGCLLRSIFHHYPIPESKTGVSGHHDRGRGGSKGAANLPHWHDPVVFKNSDQCKLPYTDRQAMQTTATHSLSGLGFPRSKDH